jgi:hypothetical protein
MYRNENLPRNKTEFKHMEKTWVHSCAVLAERL